MSENHVLNLRLLAHPFTGAAGLTDLERREIMAAADELDRLTRAVTLLGDLAETLAQLADE